MAVPRSLSKFVSTRFNQSGGYWYFTKAKTLKPESIDEIVDYHTNLKIFSTVC